MPVCTVAFDQQILDRPAVVGWQRRRRPLTVWHGLGFEGNKCAILAFDESEIKRLLSECLGDDRGMRLPLDVFGDLRGIDRPHLLEILRVRPHGLPVDHLSLTRLSAPTLRLACP
jgi:hypothetical protein